MADQFAQRSVLAAPSCGAQRGTTCAPAAAFSITAVATGDEVRIVASGELDIAARPQLQELVGGLAFASLARVVVDLRGLEFIDSTGVAFVLDLAKAACEHGTTLAFVRGPQAVQHVFAVTGIDLALTFVDELA
jgi:anti-sigma B factor antagonist